MWDQLTPTLVAHISEHRRIIAHGYEIVDDETIWQAIKDKLPILLSEAQALLDQLEEGGETSVATKLMIMLDVEMELAEKVLGKQHGKPAVRGIY